MKFVFKGMERADELDVAPSVLLGWHEKVRLRARLASRAALLELSHPSRTVRLTDMCLPPASPARPADPDSSRRSPASAASSAS